MALLSHHRRMSISDLRWRSVVTRNPSDISFVYAVRSTHIYCRPCCPSRLACRANIEFFDLPRQAEIAGYRPCKRCKPNLGSAANHERQLVQQACNTISTLVLSGQKPYLHQLASDAKLSYSHFHRIFKKISGFTPGQYVKETEQARVDSSDGSPIDENKSKETLSTATETRESEDINIFQLSLGAAQPKEYDGSPVGSIDWNLFDIMIAECDEINRY